MIILPPSDESETPQSAVDSAEAKTPDTVARINKRLATRVGVPLFLALVLAAIWYFFSYRPTVDAAEAQYKLEHETPSLEDPSRLVTLLEAGNPHAIALYLTVHRLDCVWPTSFDDKKFESTFTKVKGENHVTITMPVTRPTRLDIVRLSLNGARLLASLQSYVKIDRAVLVFSDGTKRATLDVPMSLARKIEDEFEVPNGKISQDTLMKFRVASKIDDVYPIMCDGEPTQPANQ